MGEELSIWYRERVLAKECSGIAGDNADIIRDKIILGPKAARLGSANASDSQVWQRWAEDYR